jgi:hypothetical protein
MSYLRRHHVGLLALFVALGGTSYAASQLPRNSVGTTQLRAGAVHASDIGNGAVTLSKLGRGARGHQSVNTLGPLLFDVGGVRANVSCGSGSAAIAFGNVSGSDARIFDAGSGTVATVGDGGSLTLASINNGQSAHTVLQVAWGASLEHLTTFIVSAVRPAGGCPAEAWAQAITTG